MHVSAAWYVGVGTSLVYADQLYCSYLELKNLQLIKLPNLQTYVFSYEELKLHSGP